MGGPQDRSGQVRKISLPPGFDPRTVQAVASRYTDYATRPTNIAYARYYFRNTEHMFQTNHSPCKTIMHDDVRTASKSLVRNDGGCRLNYS
jgi:hypothetical protein